MTTNIKEMSFTELNNMIANFNQQLEELRNRMNEIVSEVETRKEEAISNWKLHQAQLEEITKVVAEDTQILLGMGIDPYSLSADTDDKMKEPEVLQDSTMDNKPTFVSEQESQVIDNSTDVSSSVEEDESDKPVITGEGISDKSESEDSDEISTEATTVSEKENEKVYPLLTPYYKLFNIKPVKKKKPIKKEIEDTTTNPYTGKKMAGKLLTPFYKLCTDKPIRKNLIMGNLKYKKSFPDPEETRVVSADGYSPTLTYTHSDFRIWIGPQYDDNGEIISETPDRYRKEAA